MLRTKYRTLPSSHPSRARVPPLIALSGYRLEVYKHKVSFKEMLMGDKRRSNHGDPVLRLAGWYAS